MRFLSSAALLFVVLALVACAPAVEEVSLEEVSAAVEEHISGVRKEWILCLLRAAVWGEYDITVDVSSGDTNDEQPRVFSIQDGEFRVSVVDGPFGSTTAKFEGHVEIANEEEAFAKGVPFFIKDVVFEPPETLHYTVVSNPGKPVEEAFARLKSIGELTQVEIVESTRPLSSDTEPQERTFQAGQLDRPDRKTLFGIVTDSQLRCLSSNEIHLEAIAEAGKTF